MKGGKGTEPENQSTASCSTSRGAGLAALPARTASSHNCRERTLGFCASPFLLKTNHV